MSQLESSYFANPILLLRTLTRKVLICHIDIATLLHVTQIPLRLRRWNEVMKSGVEVESSSALLCSLFTATLNPRWEAKRQIQNLSVGADQSASGTTTAPLSTGASSSTGGGNASSSTPASVTSGSDESTPTAFCSISALTPDDNTSSQALCSILSQISTSTEPATTSETTISGFSITIGDTLSSVSTFSSYTSPTSTEIISTSRTSAIPSSTTAKTFTPALSSFTISDTGTVMTVATYSIPAPPTPSSSGGGSISTLTFPAPISSGGGSSFAPLTTAFSTTFDVTTSTSVIVLTLPTSSSSTFSTPSTTTISSGSPTTTKTSSPITSPSIASTSSTLPPATNTMLQPNTATPSGGFSRNIGAIIGVAISAAVFLILVVLVIFFTFKRYQSKSHPSFVLARWRRTVTDSDDDFVVNGHGVSHLPHRHRPLGHRSGSGDSGYAGLGGGGDQLSAGHGSAESANVRTPPPLHPAFGSQPYVHGYGQIVHRPVGQPSLNPVGYTLVEGPDFSQAWWGINDPQPYYEGSGRQNPFPPTGNRSTVSLVPPGSSSGGHGSSSGENSRSQRHNRGSLASHKPTPSSSGSHRHASTAPSALMGVHEPVVDHGRQHYTEQSNRASVGGFLTRLRNVRQSSTQSPAAGRGSHPQTTRGPEQLVASLSSPNLYSPSLLNPPVTMPPPRAIPRVPRGIAGNFSAPSPPDMSNGHNSTNLSAPVTRPPAPSPVPTDDSNMVEGLLHPRLAMGLGRSQGASAASLGDHEDHTRPLVSTSIRRPTTS